MDAALLAQGKDNNEAGRKKDKQDTVNTIAREYNNRLPMKVGRKKLIGVIEGKVDERGIWLPSYELE